jgi:hypothetical protein
LSTLQQIIKLREAQGLSTVKQKEQEIAITKSMMGRAAMMVEMLENQIAMTQAAAIQDGFWKSIAASALVALGQASKVGAFAVDQEALKTLGDLKIRAENSRAEIIKLNLTLLELTTGLTDSGAAGQQGANGLRTYALGIDAVTNALKDAYTYWDKFQDGASGRSTGEDIAGGGWVTIFNSDALLAAGERLKAAAQTTKEGVTTSVVDMGQAIASSFANFGQGIGDAIANGALTISNAGNLLMSAFGDLLSSFGAAMVAWGIGKMAIENLGISGAAAIAAGTALVIAGKAISASASKGLANVGNSLGGSSSSVGGSGSTSFSGSTVSSASAVNTGGRYVFEIEGTKLVGVLSNTLARNRALGTDLNFG